MKMGQILGILTLASPGIEADLSLVHPARKRTWPGPDPTHVGPHPVAPGFVGEHAEQTAPRFGAVHRARSTDPSEINSWMFFTPAVAVLMFTKKPLSPVFALSDLAGLSLATPAPLPR